MGICNVIPFDLSNIEKCIVNLFIELKEVQSESIENTEVRMIIKDIIIF